MGNSLASAALVVDVAEAVIALLLAGVAIAPPVIVLGTVLIIAVPSSENTLLPSMQQLDDAAQQKRLWVHCLRGKYLGIRHFCRDASYQLARPRFGIGIIVGFPESQNISESLWLEYSRPLQVVLAHVGSCQFLSAQVGRYSFLGLSFVLVVVSFPVVHVWYKKGQGIFLWAATFLEKGDSLCQNGD